MSNENLCLSSGGDLRAYGVCLLVHLVLLLHKEMDAATKNDALKCVSELRT